MNNIMLNNNVEICDSRLDCIDHAVQANNSNNNLYSQNSYIYYAHEYKTMLYL